MSVTIKDVAKSAGVSTATVSKVINNSYEISEATRERVKKVIKELGYSPNTRAQNFAKQKTKKIIFLADIFKGIGYENPHLFEIINGIEKTISEKGYTLCLKSTTVKSVSEVASQIISDGSADGLIIHASVISKELDNLIERKSFPHIVIGTPNFKSHFCWIDSNNKIAGKIAANHLIKCGYRKIAFIGGEKKDKISEHRLEGVMEGLADYDITNLSEIKYGDSTCQSAYVQTEMLLYNYQNKIDSIICANNYIAYGCVSALESNNIKIPMDIAVITFDDFPFSKIFNTKMTVVNIDMFDMGLQAGNLILSKLKKPNLHFQSYRTLPELIVRESTENIVSRRKLKNK